jgi:hypothetical protein
MDAFSGFMCKLSLFMCKVLRISRIPTLQISENKARLFGAHRACRAVEFGIPMRFVWEPRRTQTYSERTNETVHTSLYGSSNCGSGLCSSIGNGRNHSSD